MLYLCHLLSQALFHLSIELSSIFIYFFSGVVKLFVQS